MDHLHVNKDPLHSPNLTNLFLRKLEKTPWASHQQFLTSIRPIVYDVKDYLDYFYDLILAPSYLLHILFIYTLIKTHKVERTVF